MAAQLAGIETVAFCEIEPYAVQVLKKRFPGVPIYDDVRTVTAERLRKDGIGRIDIVGGGFPCQDVSCAGKQAGFVDSKGSVTRSGLWWEMLRIAVDLQSRWILAENVRNLLSIADVSGRRGGTFGRILRDLAENGYDASWFCYGAADVGAPHQRDRVFIVAHAGSTGR
ncbi:DNA-cytosine methyltransferase [Sporomusaceae bacterium BoRhaA]|uniref:DNA cytosine methyltransferase n=1 Tax=Pelorhabdus rhamnosifermentans TaxID=2772457 RepID=UPI001C062AA9|nr:DNA (cytosine-5-)-methyltransferase [Pelorhabdus rhamnosifermentans]MBU2701130.1 DNA-cytosine methyltransferase [Pelorhabdus rhamnosifermentans]